MVERKVRYFDKPGPSNTAATIQVVRAYAKGNRKPAAVVVASLSGITAAKVAQALKGTAVPIVCVTGSPCWSEYPQQAIRRIASKRRNQLAKLGVAIVDSVPSSLSDTIEFSYARYGYRSPTWMFVETLLAVGGYGLKTAVECLLMATDGGFIPAFREVVSIAGTGRGADTAIVARSTFSTTVFSKDMHKRFVVHEFLAVPRQRIFYPRVSVGEWTVEEANAARK